LPPPFAKIGVLVVNATPAERRAGEDELIRMLRPGQGVACYTFISDDELKNRDKIRKIIDEHGIDGLIVLRLVSTDKQTTYVPPTYESNYNYEAYYGGFVGSSTAYTAYNPGYTETDTICRAEISIYSVRDRRLLWAGASNTTNPADVKDWVDQVAKAASDELKKQGMLR
jgi:hypothetical protein